MQPFHIKIKHTGDRNTASYQGTFRFACVQLSRLPGQFAEGYVFRSLDAVAEMHGGAGGGLGLQYLFIVLILHSKIGKTWKQ